MKKIAVTVLLAIGLCMFAELRAQQQFPSREEIARVAADTAHYNTLLQRFLGGEDVLEPQEYIYLYYGFAMQDAFRGYKGYESAVKEIEDLLRKRNYGEAARRCESLVRDFPVSPTAWWLCYMVSSRSGEPTGAWMPYYRNMASMTDAILASGDGKTRGTAYRVIAMSDEYRVMYSLEIKNLKRDREDLGEADRFMVYPTDRFPSEELWFDKSMVAN